MLNLLDALLYSCITGAKLTSTPYMHSVRYPGTAKFSPRRLNTNRILYLATTAVVHVHLNLESITVYYKGTGSTTTSKYYLKVLNLVEVLLSNRRRTSPSNNLL